MAKEVVGSMSDWSGVLKDLFRQIDDGSLALEQVKALVGHRNPFIILDSLLQEWSRFYQKYFGLELDFSDLNVSEPPPGFERLIIVVQGLTLNQVYDVCAEHFTCWRYADDLDKAVPNNDRDPAKGAYAVWFRNRQEADEELRNLSVDQLKEKGILGITLLERLLYELKYWDEAKDHLDISNWTLCTGSRDADGDVPRVDWSGGKLKVDWSYVVYHGGLLRSRAAVPCLR